MTKEKGKITKKVWAIFCTICVILGFLGYVGIRPYWTKSKSEIDPDELARQETTLQNTETIIQLIKKDMEPKQQLLDDLKKKHQEVVSELNEYKAKDKRAEEALIAFKAGNYDKVRELFETLREEEKERERESMLKRSII